MTIHPSRILGTIVLTALAGLAGCAELKVGVGPFKAASVEVGPGGVEAKGPSAGPFKAGKPDKDAPRR
jgi:hypothetical protein